MVSENEIVGQKDNKGDGGGGGAIQVYLKTWWQYFIFADHQKIITNQKPLFLKQNKTKNKNKTKQKTKQKKKHGQKVFICANWAIIACL